MMKVDDFERESWFDEEVLKIEIGVKNVCELSCWWGIPWDGKGDILYVKRESKVEARAHRSTNPKEETWNCPFQLVLDWWRWWQGWVVCEPRSCIFQLATRLLVNCNKGRWIPVKRNVASSPFFCAPPTPLRSQEASFWQGVRYIGGTRIECPYHLDRCLPWFTPYYLTLNQHVEVEIKVQVPTPKPWAG